MVIERSTGPTVGSSIDRMQLELGGDLELLLVAAGDDRQRATSADRARGRPCSGDAGAVHLTGRPGGRRADGAAPASPANRNSRSRTYTVKRGEEAERGGGEGVAGEHADDDERAEDDGEAQHHAAEGDGDGAVEARPRGAAPAEVLEAPVEQREPGAEGGGPDGSPGRRGHERRDGQPCRTAPSGATSCLLISRPPQATYRGFVSR